MIERIIHDIRGALNNNLFFAALNCALTLPDICGRAEYPSEQSSKKRYIDWYDKEIGFYERNPRQDEAEEMPYLSGQVMYSLRYAMLHAGEPNINGDSVYQKPDIDKFSLVIQKAQPFDIYSDSSSIMDWGVEHVRSYRMNVRRICLIICAVAEAYYRDNKDKFHFDYEIIDWDEVTSKLPPLDMEAIFKELANPELGKEKL